MVWVSLVQFTASNHLAEFDFCNHLFREHWNPVLNLEHLNLTMAQFAAESDECLPLLEGTTSYILRRPLDVLSIATTLCMRPPS
jgi:hypothetical protein